MHKSEQRRRKVLYDLPASKDEFSGGGHQRTASSLANTITQFDEQTRSIGLEGRWGSGKSTIVEIAKSILDSTTDGREYYVFTFDLWINQNTNFRRSFLESLLSWLVKVDDTQKKFVDDVRDRIQNRTVDTKTVNVKSFTVFGLFVLGFLVFLPALYAWVSPAAFKDGQPSQFTYLAVAVFLLMAVATLLVAASYRKNGIATNGERPTWLQAFSNAISVFSKDAHTVQLKQNIREVDPSQNEFELTFKRILGEFQTKNRRIIIVFDNIDRLPSEKILEAWSDIRSVLSSSNFHDEPSKKVTAIVPYDRNHILRATQAPGDIGPIEQDDIFRKSFDAIFSVSPPVISDAIKFFTDKLRDAMDDEFNSNSAYRVYKIFEMSRSGEAATPRQAISFINSITALWEQWGDKISLPTIAVFMAHRDLIDKDPGMLRNGEKVVPAYRELSDDDDLFKNLAALAFNVEPEFAFQILLNAPIQQTFTSGDMDAAKRMAASPGFEVIAPEVYSADAARWATSSPTQFKNAAKNLTVLDMHKASSFECRRKILDAVPVLKSVPPREWEELFDFLDIYSVCTLAEAHRLTKNLGDWLLRSLENDEGERKFSEGQYWIAFVDEIESRFSQSHGEEEGRKSVASLDLPGGSEFLMGAGYEAELIGFDIGTYARHGAGAIGVKSLEARIVDDPEAFFLAWKRIKHLVDMTVIPSLMTKLTADLSTEAHKDDVERLGYLNKCFNELFEASQKTTEVVAMRKRLIIGGSLYHELNGLKGATDESAVHARAAALWPILDFFGAKPLNTGDLNHPVFGNLNAARDYVQELVRRGGLDEATVDELIKQTADLGRVGPWISASASSPAETGLLQQIIRRGVNETQLSALAPEVFIFNYGFLQSLLGEDIEVLLKSVGSIEDVKEFSVIEPAALPLNLLADVFHRNEPGWKALVARVDEWLKSLDDGVWNEELRSRGPIFRALLARLRLGSFTLHPSAIRLPIADHFVAMLAGEVTAFPEMDLTVDALPSNNRRGLVNDILDRLVKVPATPDGLLSVLESFPRLLESVSAAGEADTIARRILLPAIQSENEEVVQFIEGEKQIFKSVIGQASTSTIGEIQEFLSTQRGGVDASLADRRTRVCKALGLKLETGIKEGKGTGET